MAQVSEWTGEQMVSPEARVLGRTSATSLRVPLMIPEREGPGCLQCSLTCL